MTDYAIFALAGVLAAGLAIYFAAKGPKKKSTPATPVPVTPPTPTLNWPDRRPIGMLMVASAPFVDYTKPEATPYNSWVRGDRKWRVNGLPQGELTKEALQRTAKVCIERLKDINAQGIIVWDIEGQEFYHPYSYAGDPRTLPVLAPEMEALADDFFSMFKQSGIRTGICIRHDDVRIEGGWPKHYVPHDFINCLSDKISYAKSRWGCTLFYVDSNVGQDQPAGKENSIGGGSLINAGVYKEIARLHPDCLIIPEHQNSEYYLYTAPYNDKSFRHLLTPDEKGFQVLNVADGFEHIDLSESVRQGNILMGRVWYDAPELPKIKKAYQNK